jgi:hypothetical protein
MCIVPEVSLVKLGKARQEGMPSHSSASETRHSIPQRSAPAPAEEGCSAAAHKMASRCTDERKDKREVCGGRAAVGVLCGELKSLCITQNAQGDVNWIC